MPLPPEHLEQLETALRQHEERLHSLQEQIGLLQQEALIHEKMIGLGRQPKFMAALNDAYDEPGLMQRIADDADAYARRYGVVLPEGLVVEAPVNSEGTRLFAYLREGGLEYGVQWDHADGFGVIEDPEWG
jgi:hypothetical protein